MKTLLAATFLSLFACGAYATDKLPAPGTPSAAQTAQQQKMTSCNASAGDKKGDDRKAYMQTCLSATPAPEKAQSKMAMCNTKTKGMAKADADKARSECMKAT